MSVSRYNANSSSSTGTTAGSCSSAALEDQHQQQYEPLSPMHGVRPVENTVEPAHRGIVPVPSLVDSSMNNSSSTDQQLFSPVAHVPERNEAVDLSGASSDHSDDDDDDESMGRPIQPDGSNGDEFNPWQFIQSLPPYHSVAYQRPAVTLPAQQDATKKTLVLDLDETLVHCSVEDAAGADLHFPVLFHGNEYTVYVRLRPHLQPFLEAVAPHFEVVCFTASQQVYADALLDRIDPGM